LSVNRQRQRSGGNNPAHTHDREEVMVMLSGVVALILDGEPHTLAAGDVAIIPPAVSHQIENHGSEAAEWLLAARSGFRFFHANGEEAFPDWSR
jgi:quercetin dioxygenase-like cupin family protein